MPSVLPAMDPQEALEATKVYSISGLLPSDQPLIRQRPFRSPHYTTSHVGLVGGGRTPRPGEITLAHRGVLFLDELPEFGHNALESLRQPLEDHVVTISRAQWNVTFPCNFMLLAAMNPCPCGFYGDAKKECRCSHSMVSKYQRRISGPLMDRMDMFVEVPAVEYEKLMDDADGETSAQVQGRVEQARAVQVRRFEGMSFTTNSEMGPAEVWDFCQVGQDCQKLLQASMSQLNLSARAFHQGPETLPHYRRPRRLRGHRGAPPGGGVAVPAAVGGVTAPRPTVSRAIERLPCNYSNLLFLRLGSLLTVAVVECKNKMSGKIRDFLWVEQLRLHPTGAIGRVTSAQNLTSATNQNPLRS